MYASLHVNSSFSTVCNVERRLNTGVKPLVNKADSDSILRVIRVRWQYWQLFCFQSIFTVSQFQWSDVQTGEHPKVQPCGDTVIKTSTTPGRQLQNSMRAALIFIVMQVFCPTMTNLPLDPFVMSWAGSLSNLRPVSWEENTHVEADSDPQCVSTGEQRLLK